MNIFNFFFCFGAIEREKESEGEKGGDFVFGNREWGRVSEDGRRGVAQRGWEGVAGGGGARFFVFWGPKGPPKLQICNVAVRVSFLKRPFLKGRPPSCLFS